MSELTLRWISAALLIPFALFVVWFGGMVLLVVCSVFAGVMAFEWGRMSGAHFPLVLAGAAFLALLSLIISPYAPIIIVGVASVANAFFETTRGARMEAFNGLAYALVLAWSLYMLRVGPWDGLMATLFFMAIVWASDVAAFFIGRKLGGPPLSLRYSPKKTWSGAIGAVLVCSLCGVLVAEILSASYIFWGMAGAVCSVTAQLGDIFESIQKRRLEAKDASGLIPGHGGVMDRVDGLGVMCFFWVIVFMLMPEMAAMLGLA